MKVVIGCFYPDEPEDKISCSECTFGCQSRRCTDHKKENKMGYLIGPVELAECPECQGLPMMRGQRGTNKKLQCKACGKHYERIIADKITELEGMGG